MEGQEWATRQSSCSEESDCGEKAHSPPTALRAAIWLFLPQIINLVYIDLTVSRVRWFKQNCLEIQYLFANSKL